MTLLTQILHLVRYRFFLFAGIFPYLLGQALAFHTRRALNWHYFWLGFVGIILVLVGVELFNEYFDDQTGGDRIFLQERPKIPGYFFSLGILAFLLAFLVGLYLAFSIGWPIMLFAFLGFLASYFYVGPPLRWAYRGLGEFVIASSYGPLMVLGSYYLQTRHLDPAPLFSSFICGLAIFSLAIANELPDYYQDKLVGKRNLVVRLGRPKAIRLLVLSVGCLFLLLSVGVVLRNLPPGALVAFLLLPKILKSINLAQKDYENPKSFIPVINAKIILYLAVAISLGLGYLDILP